MASQMPFLTPAGDGDLTELGAQMIFIHIVIPVVTDVTFIICSSEVQNGAILVMAYPGCPGILAFR